MCDKEQLVSYVYDELDGAERKAFQHHLASCLTCREDVQALRATRAHLASWTPPAREPGFTIPAAPAGRVARRFRVAPWPLAAAAALVLAVGSAVSNIEVRAIDGGVTIRAGSARTASATEAPSTDPETREALAAVQKQVQELQAGLAARSATSVTPVSVSPSANAPVGTGIDGDELLRRVRQMITDSEGRQQQQFAVRLMQVVREMQAEHTMDLVRLEQSLNQHQAASSDEVFRQREEMKQFYRLVNQQR